MKYVIGQANRLGNRKSNQDRFTAIETSEGGLLVLGDGMGGQADGEVAAEILVQTAKKLYLAVSRPVLEPRVLLNEIITKAHFAILRYGHSQNPPVNPGTTAVVCLIQGGKATWAHVGDSRLYVFQNGLPIYRTRDHSYVETLMERGVISRDEAETHPRRNQLTRCVGCLPAVPEITFNTPVSLQVGDVVLLCTDGLWGALDDVQIGAMLRGHLEEQIDALAERAESISYPHSDNVSVLAMRLLAGAPTDTLGNNGARITSSANNNAESLDLAIKQITEVMKEYKDEIKH